MDYNSPQDIARELEARGLSPQKRFGQNFMINEGARRQIVDVLGVKAGDRVWEIGPGLGALTVEILSRGAMVRAFEIDRGYIAFLREKVEPRGNFTLVEGDALKNWLDYRTEQVDSIMGNLPYNVASAIIADLLQEGFLRPMVFTVQKEVGERMKAKPDSANYGSFSIFCQTFCTVSLPMVLRPGSFYPAPEVTSAVVKLVPHSQASDVGDRKIFDVLLRSLFSSRRKTISNNLKQSPLAASLGFEALAAGAEQAGISLGARAETLSPADFANFARILTSVHTSVEKQAEDR